MRRKIPPKTVVTLCVRSLDGDDRWFTGLVDAPIVLADVEDRARPKPHIWVVAAGKGSKP